MKKIPIFYFPISLHWRGIRSSFCRLHSNSPVVFQSIAYLLPPQQLPAAHFNSIGEDPRFSENCLFTGIDLFGGSLPNSQIQHFPTFFTGSRNAAMI